MTPADCEAVAAATRPKRVLLTHLGPDVAAVHQDFHLYFRHPRSLTVHKDAGHTKAISRRWRGGVEGGGKKRAGCQEEKAENNPDPKYASHSSSE